MSARGAASKPAIPQFAFRRGLRPDHHLDRLRMGSQAEDAGELYSKSDTALYCAKNTGRNRTVFFEEGMRKDYTSKSWLIYKK